MISLSIDSLHYYQISYQVKHVFMAIGFPVFTVLINACLIRQINFHPNKNWQIPT